MPDPITLRLRVTGVQDTHIDAAGAIQRTATLTAAPRKPLLAPMILTLPAATLEMIPGGKDEAAKAQAEYDAAAAAQKPDPNLVLGVPGGARITLQMSIQDADLTGLFMQDREFEVTLTPTE